MTSKIQMGKTTVIMYVILICTILNGSVMWRFIVGTPLNFMVLIIMQYVSCICGVLSYGRFYINHKVIFDYLFKSSYMPV